MDGKVAMLLYGPYREQPVLLIVPQSVKNESVPSLSDKEVHPRGCSLTVVCLQE